jgi:PPOX class probable F420-dependent enzyme
MGRKGTVSGMAKTLTADQADMFRGKNWATITTIREDGSVNATPTWIDTDGEHVIFNTAVGRAKERHLRRDPRVTATVWRTENPQAGYVTVEGTAELSEEGADDHIDKMAKKYLDVDSYPYRAEGERRIIVTITPTRVDGFGH